MTPKEAKISYIIPVFRADRRSLERLMNSIATQRGGYDYEILVVDNEPGAIDWSLWSWPNSRIVAEPRLGASFARNRGIAEAKGSILTFLDADVELPPDWTEACLRALAKPWVDCAQTPIVPAGTSTALTRFRLSYVAMKTDSTFSYLSQAKAALPVVNTAAFMIKSSRVKVLGLRFDTALERCEDLDFSLQLLSRGCGFALATETRALVYDLRTASAYLGRSFKNGFFSSKVRKVWRMKRPLRLSVKLGDGSVTERAFVLGNLVATALGTVYGTVRGDAECDREIRRKIEPDKRNPSLVKIEHSAKSYELSPYARLVCLQDEFVVLDLAKDTRRILAGAAANGMRKLLAGERVEPELVEELRDCGLRECAT